MTAQSTPVTNVAFFTARPGLGEELGRGLLALVAPTRREPGCLRYEIFQSPTDADAWFVYEDWRGPADFDAHMAAPYVRDFMARLPGLCQGDPDIRGYVRRSPAGAPRQAA